MFILGNILAGLAAILGFGLQIYLWIVVGRVIISWVGADPGNPIVRFLVSATEPAFRRVRRWFPRLTDMGGFDLTPLLVLAAVLLVQHAVVDSLADLAALLKKS